DRRHVTALMIQPPGVTLLRHAVADEGGAGSTQRDELVRIDWNVSCVLASKGRVGSAVLQKVAGHPVILAAARQVFDRFPEVPSMQFGAALARGAHQHDREPRIES